MYSFFIKNKRTLPKLLFFSIVGILLYLIFTEGKKLGGSSATGSLSNSSDSISSINLLEVINIVHPLSILLLQIIVIIIFSRILAWAMSHIGQPTVIGEIIAGIMLGPSLLGMYLPETFEFLFPKESLPKLEFLSQIGLILFMFIIGMELDLSIIRRRAREALFISNAGIVVPYIIGVTLAYFIYERFAPQGVGFISFSLFIGIALSITAFPVLARIVQERGISKSPLGMIVITSAAIDDISAWGILAIVVAIANAGAITGALITIGLSLIYIVIMIFIVRPILEKISTKYTVHETISKTIVAIVFCIILLSALTTEVIGIHALFGAFMAGVIMPDNIKFKRIMTEKIEDISLVLLLPLFFVFTGLRTEIGLLNSGSLWGYAILVFAVAIIGKFAGTAIASRFVGLSWKDSLTIGALMNTRGLIELVALNIGYDIGILSPEIFTILVLMALVTTFMTGPAISFINYIFNAKVHYNVINDFYKVLISFGPPRSGARLLDLVSQLFGNEKQKLRVTALHLTPNTEISKENAFQFEEQAFSKINEVAAKNGMIIATDYRTAHSVSQEITRSANRGKYNLLVVGSSQPLIGSDKTGGKARYFFDRVKCDVALIIDNGYESIKRVLFICSDEETAPYLQSVAERLSDGIGCEFSYIDDALVIDTFKEFNLLITTLECYRTQRHLGATWTKSSVSIMIMNNEKMS